MTENTHPLSTIRTLTERLAGLHAEAEGLADAGGELSRLQVASELGEAPTKAALADAQARALRATTMPGMIAALEGRLLEAAAAWRDAQVATCTAERDAVGVVEEEARLRVERLQAELREAEVEHVVASSQWHALQGEVRALGQLAGEQLVERVRRDLREADRAAQAVEAAA